VYLFVSQAHVMDAATFESCAYLAFRRAEMRDGVKLGPISTATKTGPIVDGRPTEIWMATATEV
jgi:hypothetical protein